LLVATIIDGRLTRQLEVKDYSLTFFYGNTDNHFYAARRRRRKDADRLTRKLEAKDNLPWLFLL
jgi:hypothetical protein